jgi:2-polyprenyl-3-methyl-5-hydroxy-6-metoxy-1,4-benzoquinol methylase
VTLSFLRRAVCSVVRRAGLAGSDAPASVSGVEEPAGFYDQLYAGSPEYRLPYERSFYYFLWSVIVDRLRQAKLRRILEIGCGPGQLAAYLLEQGAETYTGLDFSPNAIAMAQRNAPRGRFVVGDARSPKIHVETEHDVVICTEVLEHINDDLLVIAQFRPGKRCISSVPNFPYESHVRHFKDAGEVVARYGRFFTGLDVMTFRSPRDANDRFFLLDGIRNEVVMSQDVEQGASA